MSDNVWSRLAATLDEDERLVWPGMFLQNRQLYDSVRKVVYIVKDVENPDSQLEWVTNSTLERMMLEEENWKFVVLDIMLIVRIRLPWNRLEQEWLVTREDLEYFPDDFTIIETLISARKKDEPEKVIFNKLDFEEHREDYEVLDVRYLVAPAIPKEQIENLVNPDTIHKWIAR